MANSPNLNVIISKEDKERLKKLAASEKRSMSQLAAIAIQEYLDRHQVAPPVLDSQETNVLP